MDCVRCVCESALLDTIILDLIAMSSSATATKWRTAGVLCQWHWQSQ